MTLWRITDETIHQTKGRLSYTFRSSRVWHWYVGNKQMSTQTHWPLIYEHNIKLAYSRKIQNFKLGVLQHSTFYFWKLPFHYRPLSIFFAYWICYNIKYCGRIGPWCNRIKQFLKDSIYNLYYITGPINKAVT